MRKKTVLMSSFGGVAALCLAFGISANANVNASAEETFVIPETVTGTATAAVVGEQTLSSFKMDEKAGIRLVAPHGIRFETSISAEDLAKLPTDAKFGTLILPTSVLGETTFDLATVESLGAVNVEADVWRNKSTADSLVFSGVLVGTEAADFPEAYYGEELTAVSYVTYTDSEGTPYAIYTNVAQRSMAYVAGAELAANETASEDDKLDEEDVTFLTEIVDEVVDSIAWADYVNPVFYLGESVSLDIEGANGIPVTYTITDGVGTIVDGVLTAEEEGAINVTAKVGSAEVSAVFTAYQDVKSKIASTLKENQIAMFDSADYLELASDLLVSGYTDPAENYAFQWATGNPLYKIAQNWGGSGKRIEFPVQNTYTSGYLRMRLVFDNDDAVATKTLRIWKYDETDKTKCLTFTNFIGTHQYLYIPMSELVDENNVLKGLQFVYEGGNWSYIGEMVYSETGYGIEQTITSQDLLAGEEYDVSYTATENGVAVEGATISVADQSVLTIADGKLKALKAGTTYVTIKYLVPAVSSWISVASTRIPVTVLKGYLETIADTLGENEIQLWDSTLYEKTMSNLIIEGKTTAVSKWYFQSTGDKTYASIRVYSGFDSGKGGEGFRLTFAKPMAYDSTGYLKIFVALEQTTNHKLHIYNYNATTTEGAITFAATDIGTGWTYIYVPIATLLNEEGVLEGIQFSFDKVYNYASFGRITYVAELPTA